MQKNITRRPFLQRANSRQTKPRVPNRKRSTYSAHTQLRLVPLSEEIKREMTTDPESGSNEEKKCPASGAGSDNIHVECFVELIRMEIRKYITEMKLSDVYVKKTDLPSLCDIIDKMSVTSSSKSLVNDSTEKVDPNDGCSGGGSDDLAKKQAEALMELEQAFLSDQDSNYKIEPNEEPSTNNTEENEKPQGETNKIPCKKMEEKNAKSVHIMFTIKDNARRESDISNSGENSKLECDTSYPHQSTIPNLERRLSVLEMQLHSIYKILQRIKFWAKDSKSTYSANKLRPNRHFARKDGLEQKVRDHTEKEIEADMKRILLEKAADYNFLSEDKINPYDDLYYEWRQNRMNLVHYKKSMRSILLNQQPKFNQFVSPPTNIKVSASKINMKKRPMFVITPSRMKNNVTNDI